MKSNVYVGIKPSIPNARLPSGEQNDIGLSIGAKSDTAELSSAYDYILSPITNTRYKELINRIIITHNQEAYKSGKDDRRNHNKEIVVPEPQLQDLCIPPFKINENENNPSYIGLLSSWLEIESSDMFVREVAYQLLLNECKYAKFAGITKLILAPPRDVLLLSLYAQLISRLLNTEEVTTSPSLMLSISLPLYEDSDPLATWELWSNIRRLCDYHPSLTISLAVPRIKVPSYVLNRWLCEPVFCLLVSSSIFAMNQYGYPVLHKHSQNLIQKFQKVNGNSQLQVGELAIVVHGLEKTSGQFKGGSEVYLEYLNYLLDKGDKENMNQILDNLNTDITIPRLMPPLRPHSDILLNSTYSLFEKDIVKYNLYGEAIENALQDLIQTKKKPIGTDLVILIAGAGRGPLVDRAFRIIHHLKLQKKTRIIAIEKNPQAYLYLQKRNFDHWENQVELIKDDMIHWSCLLYTSRCV